LAQEVLINIGEKIKRLRKENNLSIQKLARRSGVSAAGIHKIESNEMIPTITTLLKIANALEKKVSFFVDEGEELSEVEYIHVNERMKFPASGFDVIYETIAARLQNCIFQAGVYKVKPGGSSGEEPMAHRGEELAFCLHGQVEFTIRGERYVLTEGDCIHFKCSIPHSFRNIGDDQAVFLSVVSPSPLS